MKLGRNPNNGLTSLFTLAKLVWFAMLKPSAVISSVAFSRTLCCQLICMSKLVQLGPRPVLRPAPIGRSFGCMASVGTTLEISQSLPNCENYQLL
jgi:hypothetical protein